METIDRAAEAIANASAILVTAGAGMGVDSGLPDFRGDEGFWKAYPPYAKLGLGFIDLANPRRFAQDAPFAWGFYGHRLALYRSTTPHAGYETLLAWMRRVPLGGFVFTSNVDGAFQRAGFAERSIHECHGALDWFQCSKECGVEPFSAAGVEIEVDPTTFRAVGPLPTCPSCGGAARPNLLMFDDYAWDSSRYDEQRDRLNLWLANVRAEPDAKIVVVECGAGTAIPTVRERSERVAHMTGGTLIRINVREPQAPRAALSIALGAKAALEAIEAARAR